MDVRVEVGMWAAPSSVQHVSGECLIPHSGEDHSLRRTLKKSHAHAGHHTHIFSFSSKILLKIRLTALSGFSGLSGFLAVICIFTNTALTGLQGAISVFWQPCIGEKRLSWTWHSDSDHKR